MSRLKKFAHSLLSGYVLLGANVLYTLASVPLALYYLSRPEFGLWVLVTQIAGYIALVDFGLSASASRILIDYKDHQRREEYGSMIQTGVIVGFSQAGLVLISGMILAFVIGPLLHIPSSLGQTFFWLFIGQCVIIAISFATRTLGLILAAHQRFDVYNYTNTALFGVNYGVLWWCFSHGSGVFSMLWAQAVGAVLTVIVNWWACHKLGLFPGRGEWGRPTWQKFHELFTFGRDIFLYSVGGLFVNASQTLLLTRLIGLDAAAVWSVCTRTYTALTQVIYRIFDFSSPALAEMMVRGERERLSQRFREIVQLSINLSVAAGVMFAVCNVTFVKIWTVGKIGWPPVNDLLLAVWLLICVGVHVHVGLVGQTKKLQFMRFLYFFEGMTFIGLNILLYRFGSITTMLLISIGCSLCFSFPYGLYRTRAYFGLSWSELARWHRDTLALAMRVAPAGFFIWWFTRSLPDSPRLALEVVVLGAWTAWMFLRFGLSKTLRTEIVGKLPMRIQRVLARFMTI